MGIADFFSKQLNLSKTQRESRTRIKVSIAAASFAVAASLVRFFLSSWVSVWVSRFLGFVVWVFFVISGFRGLGVLRDFWFSSAFQGFWVWVLFLVVWVFFVVFLASSFFFLHHRFWALAHFKPSFKHFKHAYTFFHTLFHSYIYIKNTQTTLLKFLYQTPHLFS